MTSNKFEKYWLYKLGELAEKIRWSYLLAEKAVLDVSDIYFFGIGYFEELTGSFTLCGSEIKSDEMTDPMKALAKILVEKKLAERYDTCFSFTLSNERKLLIEKITGKKQVSPVVEEPIKPGQEFQLPPETYKPPASPGSPRRDQEKKPVRPQILYPTPLSYVPRRCLCDHIFSDFKWVELKGSVIDMLPDQPGVYVLRTIEKGRSIRSIISLINRYLGKAGWKDPLSTLSKITHQAKGLTVADCPVLLISSTGNLRKRIQAYSGFQTPISFLLVELLRNKWRIEVGYKVARTRKEARQEVLRLKKRYKAIHGRPPLFDA